MVQWAGEALSEVSQAVSDAGREFVQGAGGEGVDGDTERGSAGGRGGQVSMWGGGVRKLRERVERMKENILLPFIICETQMFRNL